MQLHSNEIHVWSVNLTSDVALEKKYLSILSDEELRRSQRLRHHLHRRRFILSHGFLRDILSAYLSVSPEQIPFAYTEYHKPYLPIPDCQLQFNMSHSHDIAVYAFTLNHPLGIDIEKIRDNYNTAVAKRYFSQNENLSLNQSNQNERSRHFYRIWSRKEALIKAVGKGLSIPLTSFSVSINTDYEKLQFENDIWSLFSFDIEVGFESALASAQEIKQVFFWRFDVDAYKLIKSISL